MNAVVFGPGRIGCGFVGQILHRHGYALTYVGRGEAIEHLSRVKRFRVRLTDGHVGRDLHDEVPVARALDVSAVDAVAAAVAEASLVAVSVGPANLRSIAPLLAQGLSRRRTPVNVIAFENCADPGRCLEHAVLCSAPGLTDAGHGFSGALVSRIVSRRIGNPRGNEPLLFVGDPPATFVVQGPALCAPLPPIDGLRAVDDFSAWVLKKLYLFGAGHAAAAYLGALKGYHYVHAAIRDPEIRAAVLAAMEEGQRGLAQRYGRELAGDRAELDAIVARFENAALDDPVTRVGRDPLRKLGHEDRLVGAARLAAEAGVRPHRLALVAAAAMCFSCAQDPSVCRAPAATVSQVAGLDPLEGVGREIFDAFNRLAEGREDDNVLLSLRQLVWSWTGSPGAPAAVPLRRSA